MKRKNSLILALGLAALCIIILSATNSFQSSDPSKSNYVESKAAKDDPIKYNETTGVDLPQNMSFAGENVPLPSMDVRERLDRELTVNTYWHSSTILMHKRAHRWMPIIESILREEGVPEDFKYLAMAESGLQNVISSAGATGFWQFMKAAGKEQGLVINGEVDERYHVEKATYAACKYIKKLHQKFGSWTMAAAAYNMGPTGLQKQVDRQKQNQYYNLLLNDETSRYVFRILAIKAIHESPGNFGFNLNFGNMYQAYPHKIIIVDHAVTSWPDFCSQNNITYRDLKLLNPWLREANLSNIEKRTYKIKVLEK